MEGLPEPGEREVAAALAHCFYSTVPLQLRTYCSLTARVAREVLRRFGYRWDLLPCQLWYAGPNVNYVVGFVGRSERGKWDGHVVCVSDQWIFDTAVRHLHQFGVEGPDLIAGPRMNVPSQVIARHNLRPEERLWWVHPPPGMDAAPPEEPAELIDRLATALCAQVRRRLAERVPG